MSDIRSLQNQAERIFRRALMMTAPVLITTVDDSGPIQIAQVQVNNTGETLDNTAVMHLYGYSAVPPEKSDAAAIFITGQRSNPIIVATNNQQARLKNLQPGESALYTDEGDTVQLNRGNKLNLNSKDTITAKSDNAFHVDTKTATIEASQQVEHKTPLVIIDKDLKAKGIIDAAGGFFQNGVPIGGTGGDGGGGTGGQNWQVGVGLNLDTATDPDTLNLTIPVTIPHGGTGAITAAAALANLGGAPLDSPAFIGIPTGPTPPAADNSTRLATTAFVAAASGVIGGPYLALAGGTMTGSLILHGAPAAALEAATKAYVDSLAAGDPFLPLSGGTMTGLLTLSGPPTAALHAVTKAYSDLKLPVAGGTMSGFLTLSADPAVALHAATKGYVDGAVGAYLPLAGGALSGPLAVAIPNPTTSMITLRGNAAGAAAEPTWVPGMMITGADGGAGTVGLVGFAAAPSVNGWQAAGTGAAPTASTANASLLALRAGGHDGGGWTPLSTAIAIRAANPWTPIDHGTKIDFWTIAAGSTTVLKVGAIETDGTLYLGGSNSSTAKNTGLGTVNVDGGYFINGASIYASPALTGTPTAPTPAAADNSTRLATTAFVAGYLPLAGGTMTGPFTGPLTVLATGAAGLNLRGHPSGAAVEPQTVANGLNLSAPDGAAPVVQMTSYGANPTLYFDAAGGTYAARAALAASAVIATMRFGGWDGSAWNISGSVAIQPRAANAWTATDHSASLSFFTTPLGSTTLTRAVTLQADGTLYVGTSAASSSTGQGTVNVSGGYYIAGSPHLARRSPEEFKADVEALIAGLVARVAALEARAP
jgi:phage gp45-like